MKTLVSVLGALTMAVLISACGPDMKTINSASDRAEADATRAESAANQADTAANQAEAASKQAESAAAGAEEAVKKANDAVTSLENHFRTSMMK